MSKTLSILLTILRLIPKLQSLWDDLVALYVQSQIAKMKQENREAIRKALYEQDQRHIENAIGSPRAGEPSGIPGTTVRDTLPGVVPIDQPKQN